MVVFSTPIKEATTYTSIAMKDIAVAAVLNVTGVLMNMKRAKIERGNV